MKSTLLFATLVCALSSFGAIAQQSAPPAPPPAPAAPPAAVPAPAIQKELAGKNPEYKNGAKGKNGKKLKTPKAKKPSA